jgi:hypothetical protein
MDLAVGIGIGKWHAQVGGAEEMTNDQIPMTNGGKADYLKGIIPYIDVFVNM